MDILKCFRVVPIIFLMMGCNEYFNENNSFQEIYIKEWNSSICPKKVVLERYVKKSNFNKMIDSSSDFDLNSNCLAKYNKHNERVKTSTYNEQLILSPFINYKGKINYDIRLIIDDSIEYKITDIESKRDTTHRTFTLGRKYYIDNKICKMNVNGHKLHNDSGSFEISATISKIIK